MGTSDRHVTAGCYRLVGKVDGQIYRFPVLGGAVSIGNLPENDICIPSPTVSRHHAELRVEDGKIVIEDLGSKNGTWVNGARIHKREIRPGDWISFGPVTFALERAAPEEVQLALSLPRAVHQPAPRSRREERTRTRDPDTNSFQVVPFLNRVATHLLACRRPSLSPLMDLLRTAFHVRSVLIVELSLPEPLVVACAGPVLEIPGFVIRQGEDLPPPSEDGEKFLGGQLEREHLQWVMGIVRDGPPRALILAGGEAGRPEIQPILEFVLRLILHSTSVPDTGATVHESRQTMAELVVPEDHLVGRSDHMQEVYRQLRQLVKGDIPVLIVGETGVGKEHIARILHDSSRRARGPLVAVNCAAIPAELLEAELFGIERGVATGVTARPGKFQLAQGGTLFLDEIGDMSLELQAKLLRALQQMEVHPIGARTPEPVDVRLVTATNTDLSRSIREGGFRRDLYYRIAGYTITVPPLRQRPEDIPPLVEAFLERYVDELGKPIKGITVGALQALTRAPWLGNVRELEHEVRRLVYLCPPHQAIDLSLVSPEVVAPPDPGARALLDENADLSLENHVAQLETRLISIALARAKGNRSQAAKLLGISRNGLALKMERLGLTEVPGNG